MRSYYCLYTLPPAISPFKNKNLNIEEDLLCGCLLVFLLSGSSFFFFHPPPCSIASVYIRHGKKKKGKRIHTGRNRCWKKENPPVSAPRNLFFLFSFLVSLHLLTASVVLFLQFRSHTAKKFRTNGHLLIPSPPLPFYFKIIHVTVSLSAG